MLSSKDDILDKSNDLTQEVVFVVLVVGFFSLSLTLPEQPFTTCLTLLLKRYWTCFYTSVSIYLLDLLHHRCWIQNIYQRTLLSLVLLVLLLNLFLKFQIFNFLVMSCECLPNFFLDCLSQTTQIICNFTQSCTSAALSTFCRFSVILGEYKWFSCFSPRKAYSFLFRWAVPLNCLQGRRKCLSLSLSFCYPQHHSGNTFLKFLFFLLPHGARHLNLCFKSKPTNCVIQY